jgi:hypothetical protein
MADRMPRGAIPSPRHKLAAATPHRVVGITPPNRIYIPRQLSFWGNNLHGDCVTAEEAFAKACFAQEIFISEQEAISWATQHGFLNGAVLSTVMETMIDDGFPLYMQSYDDGPASSVDWGDADTLKNAIAHGPVKIGVASAQLDPVYQRTNGSNGWFATGFHQDEHEDHCVSLCGYGTMGWLARQLGVQVPTGVDGGQPGYAMFTWNSIGIIDGNCSPPAAAGWAGTPDLKSVTA